MLDDADAELVNTNLEAKAADLKKRLRAGPLYKPTHAVIEGTADCMSPLCPTLSVRGSEEEEDEEQAFGGVVPTDAACSSDERQGIQCRI